MKVAITGGTGSLGGALIEALSTRDDVQRVVSLSRDEVKSGDLAEKFAHVEPLRCVLADVRDEDRLVEAFAGCDTVIHAAALKRVAQSVYSPSELIKTNIIGTVNVIRAATQAGVGKVLVVSSDKAVEPVNLYGMTKAVAESYATQANSYSYPQGTRVACVRYGNVLGSRGSVVHVWRAVLKSGVKELPLTHADMTRFVITLPDAARFCLSALGWMEGGEIFVPRLPAAKLADLAEAVSREAGCTPSVLVCGVRPGGEKLYESLVSREEITRTYWLMSKSADAVMVMVVFPSFHSWREKWVMRGRERVVQPYTSDAPDERLGPDALVELLQGVG